MPVASGGFVSVVTIQGMAPDGSRGLRALLRKGEFVCFISLASERIERTAEQR